MSVTIELPNELEQTFRAAWGEFLNQKAFEALIIQGYRERVLSVGRIAELLGLDTSIQAESWLMERRVERNIDASEFSNDTAVRFARSNSNA